MVQHISVLPREIVGFLCDPVLSRRESSSTSRPATYLDCTLGSGGHSEIILDRDPSALLIGIDRDAEALKTASARLIRFADRFFPMQANFGEIAQIMDGASSLALPASFVAAFSDSSSDSPIGSTDQNVPHRFDGIVADLGISSVQLDDPKRGFSFLHDGPLDMRMDPRSSLTAGQLLNEGTERELRRIFLQGGLNMQESTALVRSILRERPFTSTHQFAATCERALLPLHRRAERKGTKQGRRHVQLATVPFQALRIAVNEEISSLEKFLESFPKLLRPRGRLAVISFHSGEDKLVARRMRELSVTPDELRSLPLQTLGVGGVDELPFGVVGRLLTAKAVMPESDEMAENSRARSARLRVFEMGVAGPLLSDGVEKPASYRTNSVRGGRA